MSSVITRVLIRKHMKPTGMYKYYIDGTLATKHCGSCGKLKTYEDFYKRSDRPDGIQSKCISCHLESSKKNYQETYEKDPTIYVDRAEARRLILKGRTDQEVNEDRERLRPDGVKACRKCGVIQPLGNYYNQRVRSDGLTSHCKECDTINAKLRYQETYIGYWEGSGIPLVCYICQEPWEEVEHVVPEDLDGTDDLSNLLPACKSCNRGGNGKFSTPLLKWLQIHKPDILHEVITRVLSYGVSPWTYLDSPEEIQQILTELEQYQSSVL